MIASNRNSISTGRNSAVAYEVTAEVDDGLCTSYEQYMRDVHIPDVLASGHFSEAHFEALGAGRYRTRYMAKSREALDQYLAEDAPGLRQDFLNHFPDGVSLTRQEWTVLETFLDT